MGLESCQPRGVRFSPWAPAVTGRNKRQLWVSGETWRHNCACACARQGGKQDFEEAAVLRILHLEPRPVSWPYCFLAHFSSVQLLSRVRLFVTPWTAARQASLSITNSWSLLKLMSIESVMPSNHLILCCPLLLPPSIFPSIRVFSSESVLCIRWPKYWSCSFSISPSKEYSGLISFRMDWLDLLAVQGTLKSFLQHHISKASNAYLGHIPLFIIY